MIDWTHTEIGVSGPLFAKSVEASIRHRIGVEVQALSEYGAERVRGFLRYGIQDWTGQTAEGVEGFSYAFGMYASGSLFGKVRMAPGLKRGGDERRPYIIARVLESGGYGGTRATVGKRTKWTRGTRHKRAALHEFRDAYRLMKARAEQIRVDLTQDLD